MTVVAISVADEKPEFNYHLLRNALDRFSKDLTQLRPEEYEQVYRTASRSFQLESLVMQSVEARAMVVNAEQLDRSVAQIRARYDNSAEYHQELQANGLNETVLRDALYRELVFDGVMQRVGARAPQVNELDAQIFYEMHHQQFEQPEVRRARHILITINDEFAENTRSASRQRIESIAEKLGQRGHRFARFARQYSECPTAMQGGELGEVPRGKLFPQLDEQLFALQENEIGSVVESEIGFHILWCERIKPAKRIPFALARAKIDALLMQRRRRNCQKHWLAELKKSPIDTGSADE